MADWTYTPKHPYQVKPDVEAVSVNRLADFSELRLEQGETYAGEYTEEYEATGAELQAMLSFFRTYRLATSFTKLSYNPLDASWDPDNPASGVEETVRFKALPRYTWEGPDHWTVKFTFLVLPNE